MNNRIILEDYTVGVESSVSSTNHTGWQTNSKMNLLNKANRSVVKYASLAGMGFSLIDNDMVFAEQNVDNVGFISSGTSDANGNVSNCKWDITLSGMIDFSKGVTITFNNTDCVYYVYVGFYDVNGNQISRIPYICRNKRFISFNYQNVKRVTIEVTRIFSSWTSASANTPLANRFVEITGVDFGKDIEASEIFGDITVYHEICPTGDDVPSATCDVKAELRTTVEQGQTIRIVSDNYVGKYTIEQVTREGDNIYSLSCADDIALLDNYSYDGGSSIAPSRIATITGIPISYATVNDSTYGYAYFSRMEANKSNCRQWLAFYSACQCSGWTTFNYIDGIKQVRFNTASHTPNVYISSYNILGNAEYKALDRYVGADFSFTYNDTEYGADSYSSFGYSPVTCPSGIYKPNELCFTRGNASNFTDSVAKAERLVMNYLNGSEITATVEWLPEHDIGAWVKIATKYDGDKIGFIKSISLNLGHKDVATIVVRTEDEFEKVV